jgi:hypothetical protein
MKRQRLLELAGVIAVGGNMNNPSQEPYTEVPSSEDPTGGPGTAGFDVVGDEDGTDTLTRIKEEAQKGVDNPDEASRCCEMILGLLDTDDEDEAPDMEGDVEGAM